MAKSNFVKNAIFNYVSISTPKLEFEAKADPKNVHMNKEYVADVLMPYAAWKKFRKAYKMIGAVEKAKTLSAAEYSDRFKIDPPDAKVYGDEDGDFTIIKFRKRAYYKDSGDATKQPQVVGLVKILNSTGKVVAYKDADGVEFKVDAAVGNGAKGTLQFTERSWAFGGKKGISLDLVALQLREFVSYESSDHDFEMEEEIVEGGEDDFEGDDDGFEQVSEQEASSDAPDDDDSSDDDNW